MNENDLSRHLIHEPFNFSIHHDMFLSNWREQKHPIWKVLMKMSFLSNQLRNHFRSQLPLTLAYAFTDYRAQGQTLEPVIVDIGPPPHGSLTPFNIYVALSRGTGAKNIQLLRDFDENLLQQHPSEYLRLEDERLEKLDEKTRQLWERREEYNTPCIQFCSTYRTTAKSSPFEQYGFTDTLSNFFIFN